MASDSSYIDNSSNLARNDYETEDAILSVIKNRFDKGHIYTYIGEILIAVNPNRDLEIYEAKVHKNYKGLESCYYQAPHVYGVAERLVHSLGRTAQDQCCVVTGETGAGKTETCKHLLEHILFRSQCERLKLKQKIQQANVVLEAFGNASTLQNKNSSRFVKYTVLNYSRDLQLQGACIHHHLLDKCRISVHKQGEGNFNVLYYLLAGLDEEHLAPYFLSPTDVYRYLHAQSLSSTLTSDSKNEAQEKIQNLMETFFSMGFKETDINDIFSLLASIILIGNIDFGADHGDEEQGATLSSKAIVLTIASLLEVDAENLEMALLLNYVKVKGKMVTYAKSVSQAYHERDMLAQSLYSKLVSSIVYHINEGIMLENTDQCPGSLEISILDSAGFENNEASGLHELMRNAYNEHLQFLFNQFIFEREKAESKEEGLKVVKLEYLDNKSINSLFWQKPTGIISALEEEMLEGTDQMLVYKLNIGFSKNPHFASQRSMQPAFSIKHFAGQVVYAPHEGFVQMNQVTLKPLVVQCLSKSNKETIRLLFHPNMPYSGPLSMKPPSTEQMMNGLKDDKKNKKRTKSWKDDVITDLRDEIKVKSPKKKSPTIDVPTQTGHLRHILVELTETMTCKDLLFIRCLRSNGHRVPYATDDKHLLRQIRYMNILETSFIRRFGFNMNIAMAQLIRRYRFIGFHYGQAVNASPANCARILKHAEIEGWGIGKSQIFLKSSQLDRLDLAMDKVIKKIVVLQKIYRGNVARRYYKQLKIEQRTESSKSTNFLLSITSSGEEFLQHLNNQVKDEDRRIDHFKSQLAEENNNQETAEDINEASRPPLLSRISSPGRLELSGDPVSPEYTKTRSPSLGVSSPGTPTSIMSSVLMNCWCTVVCYERQHKLRTFQIDLPAVCVDNSTNPFDMTRVALGALSYDGNDAKTIKVKSCIGKGIKLYPDEEGSLWIIRQSKNPVFIKGYFMSKELEELRGVPNKGEGVKIFEYNRFMSNLQAECTPRKITPDKKEDLLAECSVDISFVRDGDKDEETPCWVEVIAHRCYKLVLEQADKNLEIRRQEKLRQHNETPPIFKVKQGRGHVEVAGQKVRPLTYISTVKYNRKDWVRKKAVINPFMYDIRHKESELFGKNDDVTDSSFTREDDKAQDYDELETEDVDPVITQKVAQLMSDIHVVDEQEQQELQTQQDEEITECFDDGDDDEESPPVSRRNWAKFRSRGTITMSKKLR